MNGRSSGMTCRYTASPRLASSSTFSTSSSFFRQFVTSSRWRNLLPVLLLLACILGMSYYDLFANMKYYVPLPSSSSSTSSSLSVSSSLDMFPSVVRSNDTTNDTSRERINNDVNDDRKIDDEYDRKNESMQVPSSLDMLPSVMRSNDTTNDASREHINNDVNDDQKIDDEYDKRNESMQVPSIVLSNIETNITSMERSNDDSDDDDDDDDDEQNDRENDSILSLQSCHWISNITSQTNQPCYDKLIHHMKWSLNQTRHAYLSSSLSATAQLPYHYVNRRIVIFGDSTVFRLYAYTHLRALLMDQSIKAYKAQRDKYYTKCGGDGGSSSIPSSLQCRRITADRCSRMEQIRLVSVVNTSRVLPNFQNAEGPMSFGIDHPSCTDCRGCDTKLISCSIPKTKKSTTSTAGSSTANDTTTKECRTAKYLQQLQSTTTLYTGPAYGGFLSVEFARDVELQTKAYTTTQENIIHTLLGKEFNTVTLMNEFGKPICIVNSGQHDIAIPNVTLSAFLNNIVWYMDLLSTQCDYIIFISNNCPLTDQYVQTKQLVYEWNVGIRNRILLPTTDTDTNTTTGSSSPYSGIPFTDRRNKIFFLDIFNASITHEHLDNIHMAKSWYVALASFLSSIMNTNLGIYQ